MFNYQAAAQDWSDFIRLLPESSSGYMGLGVSLWCMRSPGAAIETWKQGLGRPYTDAAGGVEVPSLLLYAALRMEDQQLEKEAWHLLRRHARRKLTAWPGPIVPYLLGRIPEVALQAAVEAEAKVPVLRERFACQARFYRGVSGLKEGKQDLFQQAMRICAESLYGYLECEYYLASWEVKHQFPVIGEESSAS
jgi:hypothetical protein